MRKKTNFRANMTMETAAEAAMHTRTNTAAETPANSKMAANTARTAKRLLALLLAVLLMAGYMPQGAFAETDASFAEQNGIYTESADGKLNAAAAGGASDGETAGVSGEEAGALNAAADSGDAETSEENSADLLSYGTPEEIVAHMTTRQKITQCLMMEFRQWKDEDGNLQDMTVLEDDVADFLENYQFGSVILFDKNIKTTEDTLALTKDMQAAAMKNGGLPLLIATDQEGGIVYRLGSGTALPGNMAIGATGDTENAKISGEIIGRELSSLGINTTLAPVIDINNNAANSVIGTRSFGDDAEAVGSYGAAYISGLDEYDTIGCAKHFPGHGDTATDSHYGLPSVNKSLYQLARNELVPFQTAIDSGVDMIMTAHILYPKVDSSTIYSEKTGAEESRPATMSYKFLTEILREDMGFEGVVVTDAMNMAGVSNNFSRRQATYEALMAGADIICMPVVETSTDALTESLEDVITYIAERADANDGDNEVMQRLDEAALRVVSLKQSKGILSYDADEYTEEKALAAVGSDENRSLEREISAKAVTVVRNDNDVLPYRTTKDTKVLMLCPYNNEKAQMVLGLNRAKAAALVAKSVSVDVYRFSREDANDDTTLKEKIDWADLVIINSELYDTEDMSYGWYTSSVTKKATEYCKAGGKTSVVMSVNTPYDVQLYPDADAVIAVYGCKGSAMEVTDELIAGDLTSYDKAMGPNIVAGIEVIFGVYGASGTLPVNVPKFEQADEGNGSYTDEILYKRGFGITYDRLKPTVESGTVSLSKTAFKYTGRKVKPTVTVTDILGRTLSEGVDYTLSNAGRKKAGTGTVTVTGIGNYSGTVTSTYTVEPKKAYIKSAKSGRRRLTVRMTTKASKKGGSRYQVAYRVKGSSEWKYKSSSSQSIKLRKLKKGSRYEVMVRAYKKVGGVKYYGSWSKVKTSAKVR